MITEIQQGKKSRLELHEMLENIDKADPVQRVELIRGYAELYNSFVDYIRCVFDSRVNFLLPEGRPPFTPADAEKVPSSWHKQHIKLQYFVKGLKADHILPMRRESMFIGMLESVHPSDAEILVAMVAKKSTVAGLSVETVKEALPRIIS